jgi:hypothetical protein
MLLSSNSIRVAMETATASHHGVSASADTLVKISVEGTVDETLAMFSGLALVPIR